MRKLSDQHEIFFTKLKSLADKEGKIVVDGGINAMSILMGVNKTACFRAVKKLLEWNLIFQIQQGVRGKPAIYSGSILNPAK